MLRKVFLIPMVLGIAACSTLGITENPDCFKSVAVAKVAIDQAFLSAADASEAELISVGKASEALTLLDSANAVADNAGALCKIDEKTAFNYLDAVNKSLSDVNLILAGGSNE